MNYRKLTTVIASAVMLAMSSLSASASTPEPYQKNAFAFDISMGAGLDMSDLNEEQKTGFYGRPSSAFEISFRPSYFFSRHWGGYADVRINYIRFSKWEKILDILLPGLGKMKPAYTIGGIYRLESARWQFQPRLGIGVNSYGTHKSKGTDKSGVKTAEKIAGNMFCLDGGMSIAFRTSRVCALFADLDYIQPLAAAKYTKTRTGADGEHLSTTVIKSRSWGSTMNISIGIRFQTSASK
ncbi:MAG: hypothetical protein NC212_10305 [Staphylococcus sp.]|nr:hypothetical protein [Staphylococcus sp.]